MKAKKILLFLFLLIAGYSSGQSVPAGMNYQAVARDSKGDLLINSSISLKILLQGPGNTIPSVYYSEIHNIKTNDFGLFNIIIGKGVILSGSFNEIPWSSTNIWMEVAVKNPSETEFTRITSAQLFAVPYAYHAGSAAQLIGSYTNNGGSSTSGSGGNTTNGAGPVPATSWQVTGNSASNPPVNYLGTRDCKDLVFKTNGIERMRIFCNGDIFMNNNLNIGVDLIVNRDATIKRDLFGKANLVVDSNLTVKKNVNFNTTGGSTTVMGPFTVDRLSPSSLSGSLLVEKSTTLNDSLNVTKNKPTLLTGTLRVNGITDLYNSFSVNSQAPSYLTGTLRVDSNATFKNQLLLDNFNWNSQDSSTGALVVKGGTGIGRNLNVGGNLKISGKTDLNGQVKLTDTRPSEIPDSGALIVSGGVGIGKEISVRKYSRFNDSLIVEGATTIEKSLVVSDSAVFNNKLFVNGNSKFNGNIDAKKQLTVSAPSLSTANQNDYNNYPLQVQGGKQGIAVTVNGTRSLSNNYVGFFDNTNTVLGRIEGVNSGEFNQTAEYRLETQRLTSAENYAVLGVVNATVTEVAAVVQVAAAATSSTGCVGLGACVTAPIASFIVSSLANLASATVNLAAASIKLTEIQDEQSAYLNAAPSRNGVTYESGAGDYAEYLPVSDLEETFKPGNIVGVKGGKISKNTEGAERVMVISRLPVVLGNMPEENEKSNFQKVAFLGQVAIRVLGKVNKGDYILPDGYNTGFGIAVNPKALNSNDLKKIVGVAWTESKSDVGYSLINTAIGLNINDNHLIIQNLKRTVSEMKNQIASTDRLLSEMVPGYKSKYDVDNNNVSSNSFGYSINVPDENTIVFADITKQQISEAVDKVLQDLSNSTKETDQLLLVKLKENPSIKIKLIDQMDQKIQKQLASVKQVDGSQTK